MSHLLSLWVKTFSINYDYLGRDMCSDYFVAEFAAHCRWIRNIAPLSHILARASLAHERTLHHRWILEILLLRDLPKILAILGKSNPLTSLYFNLSSFTA